MGIAISTVHAPARGGPIQRRNEKNERVRVVCIRRSVVRRFYNTRQEHLGGYAATVAASTKAPPLSPV